MNSILVSLGLLKYRHEPCLTGLVDWLQNNKDIWRANDVASAIVTLATLDFVPPQSEVLFEVMNWTIQPLNKLHNIYNGKKEMQKKPFSLDLLLKVLFG